MSADIPSRASMHTARLLEKAKGEWQEIEPLVAELIALIPPGKAIRKYEHALSRAREKNTTGVMKAPLTDGEKVASGARAIVRDSINSQRSYGRIETKTEDGIEYYRRRFEEIQPGGQCPTCGHSKESADPTQPIAPMRPSRMQSEEKYRMATVTELASWKSRSHISSVG